MLGDREIRLDFPMCDLDACVGAARALSAGSSPDELVELLGGEAARALHDVLEAEGLLGAAEPPVDLPGRSLLTQLPLGEPATTALWTASEALVSPAAASPAVQAKLGARVHRWRPAAAAR